MYDGGDFENHSLAQPILVVVVVVVFLLQCSRAQCDNCYARVIQHISFRL